MVIYNQPTWYNYRKSVSYSALKSLWSLLTVQTPESGMWDFPKLLLYFPFQSKLPAVIQMHQCGHRHEKCVYLAHLRIWKVIPPFHNSHSSLNQWLPICNYSSFLKKWDKTHLLYLLISIVALASSFLNTWHVLLSACN